MLIRLVWIKESVDIRRERKSVEDRKGNWIGLIGKAWKGFAGSCKVIWKVFKDGTMTTKIMMGSLPVLLVIFAAAGSQAVFSTKGRTTQLGLKNIGELATQVGYYTNVEMIENSRDLWGWEVPFTQSKYIFSYDGVIKAGLDFSAIEVKVNEIAKAVQVELPDMIVLSNEIDEGSLEVYDESRNIFTPLTLDAVNAAHEELKAEAEETAIENGLLDNAEDNAKIILQGMLAGMFDLSEYTVEFR